MNTSSSPRRLSQIFSSVGLRISAKVLLLSSSAIASGNSNGSVEIQPGRYRFHSTEVNGTCYLVNQDGNGLPLSKILNLRDEQNNILVCTEP